MILAPVARHEWRDVVTRLSTVTTRAVKPAAPNLLAQRKPFEVLQKLREPRTAQVALDPSNTADAEWQRLARLQSLWFVRRRHLAYRDDYTGVWRQVAGIDERATELALRSRLADLGLEKNLDAALKNATPAAISTVTNLLASRKFAESSTLTAAAIGSLNSAKSGDTSGDTSGDEEAGLDQAKVLKVASQLSAKGIGDGLQKVEQAVGAEKISSETLQTIAESDDWKKVDAVARVATRKEVIEIASDKLNVDAVVPTGEAKPTDSGSGGTDSPAPKIVVSPVIGTETIVAKTVPNTRDTAAKTTTGTKAGPETTKK
jgi:hypothetical protein